VLPEDFVTRLETVQEAATAERGLSTLTGGQPTADETTPGLEGLGYYNSGRSELERAIEGAGPTTPPPPAETSGENASQDEDASQ
jgi:hypothetical protein